MAKRWSDAPFGSLYEEPSRNGLMAPKRVRGKGVRLVNMRELFRFDFIADQPMELAPLPDRNPGSWLLQDGDLLFARQSLTLAGAGKCSIVVGDSPERTFESHIIRVRLDPRQCDPQFFYYLFRSADGARRMGTIVEQVAAAGIRASDLSKLAVPCPPVGEQRRIAAVLGGLDDLIDTNQRLVRLLDECASAAFRNEWDGVTRKPLDELGSLTMGQSPPGDTYNETATGVPFHQGIRDFGARFPADRVYCTAPTRFANAGDILIAVRAPVGTTNVANKRTALGRGVAGFRATRPATTLQALRAVPSTWSMHEGTGTVFSSINKNDLLHLDVPHVDNAELERQLSVLDRAYAEISSEVATLRTTRDELLPLLMSGAVTPGDVTVAS